MEYLPITTCPSFSFSEPLQFPGCCTFCCGSTLPFHWSPAWKVIWSKPSVRSCLGWTYFVKSTSVAKHYAQVIRSLPNPNLFAYNVQLVFQPSGQQRKTSVYNVQSFPSVLAQSCGKTRYLFPTYPGSPSENGFMEPKYLVLWRLWRTPLAHHLTFGEPGSLGLVSPALPISAGELPWKQYIQIVSYNIMGNPKKQTHFIGNLHSSTQQKLWSMNLPPSPERW